MTNAVTLNRENLVLTANLDSFFMVISIELLLKILIKTDI